MEDYKIFYHGTTKENLNKIYQEGVLFGVRGPKADRCTYLTPDKEEAACYGEVVLEVKYNPYKNRYENNYIEGCWQFRVYEPITLENIREMS